MTRDPVVTADDVVRAGACSDGVAEVVQRLGTRLAAAMPVSAVLRLIDDDEAGYVMRAAELDGSGDGYGSGDGSGDGSGYGYGYGYGSGYGDGSGSGYGYGYGYGSGDGSGDGYGSGDGSGDGYGDGYGYGSGGEEDDEY